MVGAHFSTGLPPYLLNGYCVLVKRLGLWRIFSDPTVTQFCIEKDSEGRAFSFTHLVSPSDLGWKRNRERTSSELQVPSSSGSHLLLMYLYLTG